MSRRPTYIDYASPDSEKSVYFDAPIMHIFSKKSSGDAGFVAPSPKHDGNEDTPLPAEGAVLAASDQPVAEAQPGSHAHEEREQHEDQGPEQPPPSSILRADNNATAAGLVASNSMNNKMGTSRKQQQQREGSISTDPMSDSGYDSTGSPRNQPKALRDSAEMQPIPVVWADGTKPPPEDDEEEQPRNKNGIDHKRTRSLMSFRSSSMLRDRDGQDSVRTTTSGRRTPRRRVSLTGGSFGSGAGTVGPASRPEDEETQLFRSRSVSAEASLSKKQKLKIGKAELKEGKMLAKVIKQEAKVEKAALEQAVRDLSELQRIQKYAVKEEAKASASYGQALRIFHKEELAYIAARAKFERAQADLESYENAREAAREHAREATEMLQDKNRELEWLRAQKAADDRERELKLRQLAGKA